MWVILIPQLFTMPARQLTSLVFTWNNPPDNHEELLREHSEISFIIYQPEVGANGTHHLQGYLELSRRVSFGVLCRWHPWHIERRKGTQAQAIAYSSKEDTRDGPSVTWGTKKQQGQRNDIAAAYERVREGKREREIAEELPIVHAKYWRGIERYRGLILYDETKRFRHVQVTVHWGEPGTGKTRKAVEDAEGDYFILGKGSGERVWWDGYQGESTLILDDFYSWIRYSDMLNILDGYQYRCEVKGSFVYAQWTKVVITSNQDPREWYGNVANTDALFRRIDDIIHFGGL